MPDLFSDRGAIISDCGRYRYNLWRVWDASLPRVLWVMLNPSTADAETDDPTIRKCVGFARRWGFGSIEVVNLFAYRTAYPRELRAVRREDPDAALGYGQFAAWEAARSRSSVVVAAYGADASASRAKDVTSYLVRFFRDMDCLGYSANCQPRHPLMLGYATERVPYVRDGAIVEAVGC